MKRKVNSAGVHQARQGEEITPSELLTSTAKGPTHMRSNDLGLILFYPMHIFKIIVLFYVLIVNCFVFNICDIYIKKL